MKQLLSVITEALIGAIAGLFAGLVLGIIIWGITVLLSSPGGEMPPREVAAFLGMGVGTVIGGIFGGVVGMKGK